MTHLCVCKLTSIGSDNGLSPSRRQAIIWTNTGILLIAILGTNFSEILIENCTFSFNKMHLKISSAKLRPFCLGPNVLTPPGFFLPRRPVPVWLPPYNPSVVSSWGSLSASTTVGNWRSSSSPSRPSSSFLVLYKSKLWWGRHSRTKRPWRKQERWDFFTASSHSPNNRHLTFNATTLRLCNSPLTWVTRRAGKYPTTKSREFSKPRD